MDLVRNFKQVAADQASEQRRHFELLGVVKEVLDTLAPSLRRFPHQVSHTIPAAVMLDSFPGALGQVLINVINNAYLHAFEDREVGHVHIEAQVGGGWGSLWAVRWCCSWSVISSATAPAGKNATWEASPGMR